MFLFQVGFTSNNNVMLKNTKLFIYTMIIQKIKITGVINIGRCSAN